MISTPDRIKEEFRAEFVATSRARTRACLSAARENDAARAASELHSLAGEAALLGFQRIADLARSAQQEARSWAPSEQASRLRCEAILEEISMAIDDL